jgi:hypothetical protein
MQLDLIDKSYSRLNLYKIEKALITQSQTLDQYINRLKTFSQREVDSRNYGGDD